MFWRQQVIKFMEKPKHKKIYRERSFKVETMRGNENNRWLFAAMGLAIQMHQFEAFKQGKSTWIIKERFWDKLPDPAITYAKDIHSIIK